MANSAELIEQLNTALLNAYDAIEEKGGTVPEEKNADNLAEAVGTITGGGITPRPPLPEYPYKIEGLEGGEYGMAAYLRDDEVHYYTLTAGDSFKLTTGSSTTTVYNLKTLDDGFVITNKNILGFALGSTVTSLPTYTLANSTLLQEFHFPKQSALTAISDNFLGGSTVFNYPIDIPEGVRTISGSFMSNCPAFNQPITFPSTLTTIQYDFLMNCTSFNQPILLPESLTTINSRFLYNNSAFNQPIQIPSKVSQISDYFLANCTNFNSFVNLPDGLITITYGFMYNCSKFNQPLVLPDSLQVIQSTTGSYNYGFLSYCSEFDQPLEMPAGLASMPIFFMAYCTKFNSPITFRNPATTINTQGFLFHCTSFNQPVDDFLARLGSNASSFLEGCSSFNQPIRFPKDKDLPSISGYFLSYCTSFNQPVILPDNTASVGNNFLSSCYAFNQETITAPGLTRLGTYFLAYCTGLNNFAIPEGVTQIGDYAFNGAFNSNLASNKLTLPSTLITVGSQFVYGDVNNAITEIEVNCPPLTTIGTGYQNYMFGSNGSNHRGYREGIKITGPYAKEFLEWLPDRTEIPLRKLKGEDTAVYLIYALSTGDYIITDRMKDVFINTWCNEGLSGSVNIRFQPAVAELEEITTLPAKQPENLNQGFLYNCRNTSISGLEYFTHLTTINDYFLYQHQTWDGNLPDLSKVTSIGTRFLYGCLAFTQPVTLSDNLKDVGDYFMYNCNNFTGPLNVGKASGFAASRYTLSTTNNSAPMYTEGITLTGTNAAYIKEGLPDYDTSPYRKLIVAESA